MGDDKDNSIVIIIVYKRWDIFVIMRDIQVWVLSNVTA